MSSFEDVADHDTSKYLQEHEASLYEHTVSPDLAGRLVRGYLALLADAGTLPPAKMRRCVDIGCGVGNITAEFSRHGMGITGIEYGAVAVEAARRKNPDIEFRSGDLREFLEPEQYDFIFSREVYLFTRVNAFTDQLRIFEHLVASLKPGGILMVSASRCNRPHCADYELILRTLRTDPVVAWTSGTEYEQLLLWFWPLAQNRLVRTVLRLLLGIPVKLKMARKPLWSPQYVLMVKRRSG